MHPCMHAGRLALMYATRQTHLVLHALTVGMVVPACSLGDGAGCWQAVVLPALSPVDGNANFARIVGQVCTCGFVCWFVCAVVQLLLSSMSLQSSCMCCVWGSSLGEEDMFMQMLADLQTYRNTVHGGPQQHGAVGASAIAASRSAASLSSSQHGCHVTARQSSRGRAHS